MNQEYSDEEIISQWKDGNQEAFKELIERYTSSLYNFIIRFVGQENTPDLVQEIFIKIWKKISSFDISKASFKTWIFTVAKNTIVDFLRKKKSIPFSDFENENKDFSENIKSEEILPDETLQKIQDSELLNKLLDKLPENYKTVLILHYQEEMTFDEIGKILEKPLNTVKSYHQRAIMNLRKMFF
jgi:RNA polymerase sigma-70 factor, ECF subfamily